MLYAEKDANGVIVAIRKMTESEAQGNKPVSTADLADFLSGSETMLQSLLAQLDIGVIRVLDDLIDLLVRKNIIVLTDLPEEARKKLFERKSVRYKMQEQHFLADDIL